MSDSSSVEVTFGANVSQLNSGVAQAKAKLEELNAEAKKLAQQMITAGRASDASLTAALSSVKGEASSLASVLKTAENGLENTGNAGHHGGTGLAFYTRELHALVDEFGSGRIRQGEGTLANLVLTFLQGHAALVPYAAALAAVGGSLGYVAYQAIEAANAQKQLTASAAVGQFHQSAEAATQMKESFADPAGVSRSVATDILASWEKVSEGGGELATTLIPYMKALAQAEGVDVAEASKELLARVTDLNGAGLKYVESIHGITTAEIEQMKQFAATGQQGSAWGIILKALQIQLGAVAGDTTKAAGELKAFANSSAMAAAAAEGGAGEVATFGDVEKQTSAATADLKGKLDDAGAAAIRLGNNASAAAAQLRNLALTTADSFDHVGAETRNLERQSAQLGEALGKAYRDKDADAILRITAAQRGLNEAQKENQQKASDPTGLNRDIGQQTADNVQRINNTIGLSTAQRLQREIALEKQTANDVDATEQQKYEARKQVESLTKQLYDDGAKASTKAARDVLGEARQVAQEQVQLAQKTASESLRAFEDDFAKRRIGAQTYLADVQAVLDREQDAIQDAYENESRLAGLSLTQKRQFLREEDVEVQNIADKMADAQRRAADEVQKTWEGVQKSINSPIDGQVDALLRGTESLKSAAKNIAASYAESLIKGGLNMALTGGENAIGGALGIPGAGANNNSPMTEAMKAVTAALGIHMVATTASTAATTVNAGATTANAAATTTHAGVTLASVSATLANTLAVFANTVATDAAAVAQFFHVPGFAVGTPYVEQTGLSLIHQGEAVIPASLNPYNRGNSLSAAASSSSGDGGGAAGGGVTHNHTWNINAVDAGGVRAFFHDNAHHIASGLHQAVKGGNPSALKMLKGR